MRIFRRIARPRSQAHLKINEHASWFTWSADFQSLFAAWQREVRQLKPPRPLRLLGRKEYDNTFSLALTSISDKKLTRDLLMFAEDLYNLKIDERIMFLDGMLSGRLGGHELHYLLAFLRAALVSITGDPLSAVHQPLHREYKRPRSFPLHSDLYLPRILLNIFDAVPPDQSGATTLLPAAVFLRILPSVGSMDLINRRRIRAILREPQDEDRYEEFYHLLHDENNEWAVELERKMTARQLVIKLYAGQGYIIDDRLWLHGRETPSTGITRRRLHRLIFNTKDHTDIERE